MGNYLIDLPAILKVAMAEFQKEADKNNITLYQDDLEWEAWPQMWASTALGYGGLGGAAMTHAQTVIVTCRNVSQKVAVFFGCERLAYMANERSPGYEKAYANKRMPSCRNSSEVQ